MEAKGTRVVDIFADDKKQGQGILGKAIFDQVPTDEEIKELLRGKTAEEKRTLLKEIEKARQAKIHMTYLLEQQKLKNDEKWAVRNVEERQAVLNLYCNSVDAYDSQSQKSRQVAGLGSLGKSQGKTEEPSPGMQRQNDDEDPIVHNPANPQSLSMFPPIGAPAPANVAEIDDVMQYQQQYKREEDFEEVGPPPIPGQNQQAAENNLTSPPQNDDFDFE